MSPSLSSFALLVVMVCALTIQCVSLTSADDQDTRRVARGRYKMGYMFGKRSDEMGVSDSGSPAVLLSSFLGKAVSVEELSHDLQTDKTLARRIATHLDRNGDGYVSVRELL